MRECAQVDDLRIQIWDLLHHSGQSQPIAVIADQLNQPTGEIEHAVDDPWFEIRDGMVAIAKQQG